MRWAAPGILWLIPATIAGMAVVWWGLEVVRRRRLLRLLSAPMLARLVAPRSLTTLVLRRGLTLIAVVALLLGAARPQWGITQQTIRTRGLDVVFVLDTSLSMLAGQHSSRLATARQLIDDLIERLPGDRIGLVAFAGEAHILCPLTLDRNALRLLLWSANTSLLPTPGSDLGAGIVKALKLFHDTERKHRVVILVSDGEDHEQGAVTAAAAAHDAGVIVHAIGVGSEQAESIAVDEGGELKRDSHGEIVMTRLEVEILREVARTGGGLLASAERGAGAVQAIVTAMDGMERRALEEILSGRLEEQFELPLGVALAGLSIEAILALGGGLNQRIRRKGRWSPSDGDRRGSAADGKTSSGAVVRSLVGIVGLLLMTIGDAPGQSHAQFAVTPASSRVAGGLRAMRGVVELELASPQAAAGAEAYAAGRFADAVDHYRDAVGRAPASADLRYDLGTALLAAGQIDEAGVELTAALASGLAGDIAARARYNLAHAHHIAGELAEALAEYRSALVLDSGDDDAKHNFEIVLAELRREQPSPTPSPSPSPTPTPQDGQAPTPTPSPGQGERPPSSGVMNREEADRLLDAAAEQESMDRARRVERAPTAARPRSRDW